MLDMKTKTFVDVSRDKLLLPESISLTGISQTEGNELCTKLKQLYESIGIKFFEVKLDEKFTSVPAIIVNHVHLSAQLEKLLANNAATKRTEQYKPVFERKDMLVSGSNLIIQYLYKIICIDNIPLDNIELVELARTIYTSALVAGGYEPDNAFKFIKTFNKLLLESISK